MLAALVGSGPGRVLRPAALNRVSRFGVSNGDSNLSKRARYTAQTTMLRTVLAVLILDWASFVQAFCDLTAAIASLLLVFILIPLILCLLCGCGVFLCFCGGLAMCGLAASEAGDV